LRRDRTIVVVFVVIVAAVLAVLLAGVLGRAREEARRIRCRNNLNQLAKGMALYVRDHDDNPFYPCPLGRTRNHSTYNGAEWLASLYWTGVVPDPGVFICPSAPDSNNEGRDLGSYCQAATFGSQTVSYAGMHYGSLPGDGAIGDYYPHPTDTPMASDDTQGDINHGGPDGGMAVLFFDSHIEFRTNAELDPRNAVGQKGGLLEQLRN